MAERYKLKPAGLISRVLAPLSYSLSLATAGLAFLSSEGCGNEKPTSPMITPAEQTAPYVPKAEGLVKDIHYSTAYSDLAKAGEFWPEDYNKQRLEMYADIIQRYNNRKAENGNLIPSEKGLSRCDIEALAKFNALIIWLEAHLKESIEFEKAVKERVAPCTPFLTEDFRLENLGKLNPVQRIYFMNSYKEPGVPLTGEQEIDEEPCADLLKNE